MLVLRQLSPEVYEARIKIHRAEYISERDFVIIKRMGMDTVRIPVPYFIFGDREPFIGCIEELDKAFHWAERYGLKILIDLHTAPESQNGFDNRGICGVCKWAQNPDEVEFVHTVLERLAKRYGHREGLWGIEAINEPIMEGMWELFDVPNRYPAVDKEMEQYFPVICGEWCLFNSLACGYDTNGGKNVFNNVENVGESVIEDDKKAQIYRKLAKVQIDAWNQGSGCIEAPHLYKRNGYYYIMCAEGGTGYGHSVTMGRSKNVWGPYEKDPQNPIVTSIPGDFNERHDPDHLKPKYFNPDSILQKSGHGSYIENELGEVYLVHLTSRPFVPELHCTLGRETAMQKMKWTEDGWLRMADGSNLAKEYFEPSKLPEVPVKQIPDFDDFDDETLGIQYYAPRIMPQRFVDLKSRPGYLRMRGQESRTSLNKVSILARKLTSVHATITTKMEFKPEVHQHSAGLIMYYDNMNYINLRKYYSETLGQSALSIIHLENGEKTEFSDEYCKYGEFTGTFVGITCADRVKHQHYADFDFFEYIADETKDVN